MRIVLAGGGTGGHLMPLVSVAKKLRELKPEAEFFFLGPGGKMEKEFIGRENISQKTVISGKLRRYFSILNFFDMLKIPIGFVQALWHLLWIMPDAIFSKGSYASLPTVVAGWLYRIPIMIHESDANPGLANSMLAKFSERVAVSYPQAQIYFPAQQVVLTGNPVRADITMGDPEKAREMFKLSPDKKIIFVAGGSLGARGINLKILSLLPELLAKYQIIHQTGVKNFHEAKEVAGQLGIKAGREGYYPIAFYGEELKDILAVSDLVISRASANTISEIAACGKPTIIIPLENAANNHQRMNAYAIAKTGGCVVLEETNLGHHMLMSTIDRIINDSQLREKLAKNIRAFYHPEAAEKIAKGILEMIKD
jgi:UDP-N-acetylglucosamine--N-acetylmuramyl-(pentapeptide) pyrophosphoryl-undecaprenol N-acetylglucosamine transferase